jgi:hypothetical protein
MSMCGGAHQNAAPGGRPSRTVASVARRRRQPTTSASRSDEAGAAPVAPAVRKEVSGQASAARAWSHLAGIIRRRLSVGQPGAVLDTPEAVSHLGGPPSCAGQSPARSRVDDREPLPAYIGRHGHVSGSPPRYICRQAAAQSVANSARTLTTRLARRSREKDRWGVRPRRSPAAPPTARPVTSSRQPSTGAPRVGPYDAMR